MSRGYQLTAEARENVEEICAFILADNVDAALRVHDAFEHASTSSRARPR